ncbi:MAG: imidazole glycerol phosphate synthase subunit HisH [Alphaproteobacteria bacterium]
MKKITIVDCGIGNRASILNMLEKLGYESVISRHPKDILSADLLILPGIGSFDAFMSALYQHNLLEPLEEAVLKRKTPLLGICLGMQVLLEKSDEGVLPGLGWIKGEVCALRNIFKDDVKIPHIGWEEVSRINNYFLPSHAQYYFVHSYYCQPKDSKNIAGEIFLSDKKIVVAIKKDNIYGVQFHPEKSHRFGLEFFKKFINHVEK